MPAAGQARGGLGWVILIGALAVPGVLFYNWWSHLKAEREKMVVAKGSRRVPEGGVFQSSPNAKFVNPITTVVSTETATALIAVSSGVVASEVVGAPLARALLSADPKTAPEVAISTPVFSSATLPSLKRDPMLSPFDRVRILEEEEARRRAASDLTEASQVRSQERRVRPAVNPADLVELQGIIGNHASGYNAIINNAVVGEGEFVETTKIKVVKITESRVIFEFKAKRFFKSVRQDQARRRRHE